MPDFAAVYADLHAILQPYAASLDVKHDDDTQLYLDTRHVQANKKPMFFGAVQIKKAYVSYHLMPIYYQPDLVRDLSPALRARMQGTSCFNFTASDPALFEELARLTQAAYRSFQEQGFV